MLDRAESAGLVQRGPDPRDRRANLITMTRRGRAIVGNFAPRLHAVLQRVIHRTLDREEIDCLVDLVNRIAAAAARFTLGRNLIHFPTVR